MSDPESVGDPNAIRPLAQEIAARADIAGDTPAGFAAALDAAGEIETAAARVQAQ